MALHCHKASSNSVHLRHELCYELTVLASEFAVMVWTVTLHEKSPLPLTFDQTFDSLQKLSKAIFDFLASLLARKLQILLHFAYVNFET